MLGTSAYIPVIYFRLDWDRMGQGRAGWNRWGLVGGWDPRRDGWDLGFQVSE